MIKQVEPFLQAFDSLQFELRDIMVEGTKVAVWFEISGIHTSEFFGIEATNKPFIFRECAWYDLKDGKLDVVYAFIDWTMFFEQIGEYPKL